MRNMVYGLETTTVNHRFRNSKQGSASVYLWMKVRFSSHLTQWFHSLHCRLALVLPWRAIKGSPFFSFMYYNELYTACSLLLFLLLQTQLPNKSSSRKGKILLGNWLLLAAELARDPSRSPGQIAWISLLSYLCTTTLHQLAFHVCLCLFVHIVTCCDAPL